MGVKRRLVDQGLWFNAWGTLVHARFLGSRTFRLCDTVTAKFDRQRIWMLVCRCTVPGI